MNKKRYGIPMVFAVILLLVLLLSVSAAAQNASETDDVISPAIKIYVDGILLMPADDSPNNIEPMLYDGTVYLPIWTLREAFGKPVEWDSASNSVYIGESAEIAEITVSTAEELISALGSNRRILLKEGIYNLTAADPEYVSASVYSGDGHDGPQLFLDGVHNLTIQGIGDGESEIVVEPRYANVLNFRNCSNISIVNIRAGHTDDGMCSGGVFWFENCAGIQIDDTQMYGCGAHGLILSKVTDIKVTGSTIYGCTSGIMSIQGSSDILFTNCVFRDNKTGDLKIGLEHVSGLMFDSCSFLRNAGAYTMFYLAGSENIAINNTEFIDNDVGLFAEGGALTVDASSRFENNLFDAVR